MQNTSRLYHCCRCHAQVIICSQCDRGQRYCTQGCSQEARAASLKRAGKKYQSTRQGRFNNAARQQRHRQRQKDKVTQQRSLQNLDHDLLDSKLSSPVSAQEPVQPDETMCCHHCGLPCSSFLRSDFLTNSRLTRAFRRRK